MRKTHADESAAPGGRPVGGTRKRPYVAPTLTNYGAVSALTRAPGGPGLIERACGPSRAHCVQINALSP
ncbi:MAG TPA: lasso RiPP family leader peptide-containing protein [Rubricoccaceae bacterium]|nr:lasso RiPP family leader peptide-containing protein [Rubricoccaceae bacterium]